MAVEGHDGRITVSTLAEARYFAAGGFKDILYGVGIVPAKLPVITELRRQGVNLRIVTDNLIVAKALAAAASSGDTFSVFIEIDSGAGRAGLPLAFLDAKLSLPEAEAASGAAVPLSASTCPKPQAAALRKSEPTLPASCTPHRVSNWRAS